MMFMGTHKNKKKKKKIEEIVGSKRSRVIVLMQIIKNDTDSHDNARRAKRIEEIKKI